MKITKRTVDAEHNNNEYHIASFVAHAMFSQLEQVQAAIEAIEGAEIHAKSEEGKLVFTIEDNSQKAIGKKIDALKHNNGLFSFSPIYHQYIAEDDQDATAANQLNNSVTQ